MPNIPTSIVDGTAGGKARDPVSSLPETRHDGRIVAIVVH
jgi:hypothetical protein